MTKKAKIISVLSVVALIIAAKGLLSSRKAQIANDILPSDQTMLVPVVKAKKGELQNRIPFLAQILSDKSITLSTKLAGYVEKVMVEESQKVKKGDVLVKIDAIELRSNIGALESTLRAQKNDFVISKNIYDRNKKLLKVGGLAKEKLDISLGTLKMKRAIVQNTEEKISQLKHQLSYLQIVAPFDGEIDTLFLHEGDLAASGKPILAMSNRKKKLIFSYSPTRNSQIKKEQDVFMDAEQIGYVKSIYTTSKNGLISAEIALNKVIDYPVGSSVNISVLSQDAKGCLLPSDTVLHKKEGTYVMEYKEGRFSPLKVTIEMQSDHNILLTPCPKASVAQASEVKLATLPAHNKVEVTEAHNE